MIFEQVKASIKPGLQLPGTRYTVKGLGERHGEPALIYKIPNNREPGQHYEKGIAKSEWELAYRQLLTAGELSRRWFDSNMKDCAKAGPCQFLTIGGVFVLLGVARKQRGKFTQP